MADYTTIDKLLTALQNAPQQAEGRFKVNTWAMVLESLIEIRDAVQKNQESITGIPTPEKIDVVELTENIKGQIKDEMTLSEEDSVIMF